MAGQNPVIGEDDDVRDAKLFRFWAWASCTIPLTVANVVRDCHSNDDYRKALTDFARSRGVNIP